MPDQSWKDLTDAMRVALPDKPRKTLPPGQEPFEALRIMTLFRFVPDGEIMEKCGKEAASHLVGRGTVRVGHKTIVYPLTDDQAAAARVEFPRPRVPVDGRDLIAQFDVAPAAPAAKAKRARAPGKVPKGGGGPGGSP